MTRPDAVLDALYAAAAQRELATAARLDAYDATHCPRCGATPGPAHVCKPTTLPRGVRR